MNKIRTQTQYITTDGKEFYNLEMADAWQNYLDIEYEARQEYNKEWRRINNQLCEQFMKEVK